MSCGCNFDRKILGQNNGEWQKMECSRKGHEERKGESAEKWGKKKLTTKDTKNTKERRV
jgi:hypothetical protein